ncbi:PREDICTED: uncharacterized protein DDB_G0284459-like [Ceratosolen solmsi marchali]|uniref:Uncharacterized protein DDB_G0284459-like n=1 Tax=Ceratosolen solmsi marchali TaxID=326594 RepID=A0AAJ7DYB9_9HYME|nr:PREDICTED: uncharacterized protein DDB_G0284459-like [Ceratosolen solmsi marchali]
MVVLKENGCRICPKIFCCTECRDIHENRKHPNPKCSLCLKQDLPYKPLVNPELRKNSEFFCHIAFNHLPLGCKLCGDKYTGIQDLLTAQSCRWWSIDLKRKQRESQAAVTVAEDVPHIAVNDSGDSENNLPVTPLFAISIDDSKSLKIADSSSILRLKQENFDSPPELVRHTSTPMHSIGVLGQKQLGTAAIPQFVLKTPSSFDKHTFETTESTCSHVASSGFESRYYTGISSSIDEPLTKLALSNNNTDNTGENQPEVDPSWNSPSCPVTKNHLPPMSAEVANDKKDLVERSIMKSDVLDRVSRTSDSSRDSIGKRVRFSDQCPNLERMSPSSTNCSVQETAADSSAHLADSEIFFEAQESLDDSGPCDGSEPYPYCQRSNKERTEGENSPTSSTSDCINDDGNSNSSGNNNSANCSGDEKNGNDKVDESSCSENVKNNGGDDRNDKDKKNDSNNNNQERKIEKDVDSSVEKSKTNTSSRVLMMVLVEKTDSKSLSSLDLRPLIDSGLKKLEKRVAAVNSSPHTDKGYYECSCQSSKFSTEVSSFARKVNSTFVEDKSAKARFGSFRATGREERQAGGLESKLSQEVRKADGEPERQVTKKADGLISSCMSDGIFSVVARVVRCALKKLPAVTSVTSRNLSREPLPQTACSPVRITTTSSLSITSAEVLAVGSGCSASTSHIMLQRSASKRPRDRLDSGEESRYQVPRDSSGKMHSSAARSAPTNNNNNNANSGSNDSVAEALSLPLGYGRNQPHNKTTVPGNLSPRSEVISSPAAKRHRGWYRIRAREPIARMRKRQIVSPRGASLETQRFQQGSLTIGDTYLPLPSRAHQSTQTE